MNIIEEGFQNKEEKKKKMSLWILILAMALIVFVIIGIMGYLSYLKSSELKVYLNNQSSDQIKEKLLIEEDGTVYMPIKDIASFFGYQSYNGEYGNKSEDISKCYVESETEIANFSLNSNKIYKLNLTDSSQNYYYEYSESPVKAVKGVLYATSETIEKAFNLSFEYNKNTNKIYIYTLPYLVESYETKILDYGYTELSDEFINQKAIVKAGLLVVKTDKSYYGVIDTNGNVILEAKYDEIQYIPESGDFLVKASEKYGILSKNKTTKVQIAYDSIELMDGDSQLYLVKKDEKYGVIDFNGKTKIYIENDEIGINVSEFSQNGIKNNYILAENLIPVKKDGYWGLFNKNGDQVTEFKYDSLGYIASSNKDAINLLVIPDYNVLVVCQDKKYTLLNTSGKELFAMVADDIYMTISEGKTYYYIIANNNKINAIEFLDSIGIQNKNNKTNSDSQSEENENNTDEQENSSNEEEFVEENEEESEEEQYEEGQQEQDNEQNDEENEEEY